MLPTELPTVFMLESSGLITELPTELLTAHPHMKVVGILICMENSHGQPTPLPTKLPTVSVYGRSGQPNLNGKISMDSSWAAYSTSN